MDHGIECAIYEKEDYVGGLCHSFNVNGFSFDSAVHLSFTNSDEVRSVFDQTPYLNHKPIAYNFYDGMWVKHVRQRHGRTQTPHVSSRCSSVWKHGCRNDDVGIKHYFHSIDSFLRDSVIHSSMSSSDWNPACSATPFIWL